MKYLDDTITIRTGSKPVLLWELHKEFFDKYLITLTGALFLSYNSTEHYSFESDDREDAIDCLFSEFSRKAEAWNRAYESVGLKERYHPEAMLEEFLGEYKRAKIAACFGEFEAELQDNEIWVKYEAFINWKKSEGAKDQRHDVRERNHFLHFAACFLIKVKQKINVILTPQQLLDLEDDHQQVTEKLAEFKRKRYKSPPSVLEKTPTELRKTPQDLLTRHLKKCIIYPPGYIKRGPGEKLDEVTKSKIREIRV